VNRPRAVLAMYPGLERAVFRRSLRERLDVAVEVLDWSPLGSWDDERTPSLLAEAEILLTHWGCPMIDATVLDRAPNLRFVAHGAGTVKGGDLAIMTRDVLERGVLVTTCASANAVPVAEYALAAIVWSGKDAFGAAARLRGIEPPAGWTAPARRLGNWDQRIGLVGASLVGRHLIELLRPFRVHVSVYDPYLSADDADRLGVTRIDDLVALAAGCDVLSVHAPDVPATRGMISADVLAALPDGATFLNTARPALVDQDALLREVATGRISAVLDVTDPGPLPSDHPLLALPNVVVTPYLAGSQDRELGRLGLAVVEEVERYVAGDPPGFPVTLDAWEHTA